MKAIRAHRFGGPEVLEVDEVVKPTPGAGEVLVRVVASSVNPIDWKLREGMFKEVPLPFTTGGDFSGVIEAVGPGVADFKVGQKVFGVAPGSMGAHAEFVVEPAKTLAHKPTTLDHLLAASVPLTALTAWQALFDHGKLLAREHVFILGASGGVGSFAVQFARNAKAWVSGTASTENVERVRELGASQVIDYKRERFDQVATNIDLCLDLVGGDLQQQAFNVMKKGGRLISTVEPPDEDLAASRGVTASFFMMQPRGPQLHEIARQIDAGMVRVNVAKVMPLEKTSEAEELNRQQKVTGKIVLRVAA
jgi:NADPH:quinone reductase-like Zn-dependent oxidoreductase